MGRDIGANVPTPDALGRRVAIQDFIDAGVPIPRNFRTRQGERFLNQIRMMNRRSGFE